MDTQTINKRMVCQMMENNRWMQDVMGDLTFTAHMQLMHLHVEVGNVHFT